MLQLYVTFSLFQIVGFLTGILVGVPTAAYITYNLMDDETPKTPFLENISRKKAARPAIIVQEELKRVYVSKILGVMGFFKMNYILANTWCSSSKVSYTRGVHISIYQIWYYL